MKKHPEQNEQFEAQLRNLPDTVNQSLAGLTAFYNVFQGCTHNRVTFSRFYMKKIDAEIEFTVQTDTCSFLDVL